MNRRAKLQALQALYGERLSIPARIAVIELAEALLGLHVKPTEGGLGKGWTEETKALGLCWYCSHPVGIAKAGPSRPVNAPRPKRTRWTKVWVTCRKCHASGPFSRSEAEAWENWRKPMHWRKRQ